MLRNRLKPPEKSSETGGGGDQLDSIAKGVLHMAAAEPRNLGRLPHLDTGGTQFFHQPGKIPRRKRWMGLARRPEVLLDSQVYFHRPALEPAATAVAQCFGFRNFGHAEQTAIEAASGIFSTRWHRQLDMVNGHEDGIHGKAF
jgi:hypothetical protein